MLREAWDAVTLVPNSEGDSPPPPSKFDPTRASEPCPPASSGDSPLGPPEAVHLRKHAPDRATQSVVPSRGVARSSKHSSDNSTLSTLSNSVIVEEIQAPELVKYPYSNDYKGIVTNFVPVSSSEKTFDDDKADQGSEHVLQPRDSVAHKIATAEQLAALTTAYHLPEVAGPQWLAQWRYIWCSAYRKLWALVIVANVVSIAVMISRVCKHPDSFSYEGAATATGANLLVAALMRHEHSVNLLFRIVCLLPHLTPLAIRRRAAKVYSYGGIHSGCGVSALLWYIFYTVLVVTQFKGTYAESAALAATTSATLLLFIVIVSTAHPYIRRRWHNQWELSHRFSGWTAIALVWAQTLIIVVAKAHHATHSIGITLVRTPTFWFLLIITACLIYPWLRLRKRKVRAEKLSTHAVRLHFEDKTLPSCVGYRLAHKPLTENHGFATIPNSNGQHGYSIVVSNAGDWTKDLINNPRPKIWTRGAPTTGVMKIALLFRPIIVVATGSGIGPCLSFLQVHPDYPMRIIWSARWPEATYGPDIMKAVARADRQALIVDTKQTGTPDLVGLTFAMYKATNAEAVVVISNPVVTAQVVYAMESRNIPAFGPVFDS